MNSEEATEQLSTRMRLIYMGRGALRVYAPIGIACLLYMIILVSVEIVFAGNQLNNLPAIAVLPFLLLLPGLLAGLVFQTYQLYEHLKPAGAWVKAMYRAGVTDLRTAWRGTNGE